MWEDQFTLGALPAVLTLSTLGFNMLIILRKLHTFVVVSLVSVSHPLTGVMNLPIHVLRLKKGIVVAVEWGERLEQKLALLPWPCSSLEEAGARVRWCDSCGKPGSERVWIAQQVSWGWTNGPGRHWFVNWTAHSLTKIFFDKNILWQYFFCPKCFFVALKSLCFEYSEATKRPGLKYLKIERKKFTSFCKKSNIASWRSGELA